MTYSTLPRCCPFFVFPRREEGAYPRRSVTDEQPRRGEKRHNPEGEDALGWLAALLAPYRSLWTCSSARVLPSSPKRSRATWLSTSSGS